MTSGPENTEPQSPEQTPSSEAAPSPLVAALQREHPEWVREVIIAFGETTIVVPRESIAEVCSFLKTSPETRFDFLADICGADRGVEECRLAFLAQQRRRPRRRSAMCRY